MANEIRPLGIGQKGILQPNPSSDHASFVLEDSTTPERGQRSAVALFLPTSFLPSADIQAEAKIFGGQLTRDCVEVLSHYDLNPRTHMVTTENPVASYLFHKELLQLLRNRKQNIEAQRDPKIRKALDHPRLVSAGGLMTLRAGLYVGAVGSDTALQALPGIARSFEEDLKTRVEDTMVVSRKKEGDKKDPISKQIIRELEMEEIAGISYDGEKLCLAIPYGNISEVRQFFDPEKYDCTLLNIGFGVSSENSFPIAKKYLKEYFAGKIVQGHIPMVGNSGQIAKNPEEYLSAVSGMLTEGFRADRILAELRNQGANTVVVIGEHGTELRNLPRTGRSNARLAAKITALVAAGLAAGAVGKKGVDYLRQ